MGPVKGVVNLAIAVSALVITFFVLNYVVAETRTLDGISLTEALADEFRIAVLPVPLGFDCRSDDNGLIPLCTAEYSGYSVRIPESEITINSAGFRGKEYPVEKEPATFRIFMLGDSFTFGPGVDNDETFVARLEEKLNEIAGTRTVEVFNLGVGGMSTDDEYLRLLQYWNYSPDLIVLQSHPNDIIECGRMKEYVDQLIKESLGRDRYLNLSVRDTSL